MKFPAKFVLLMANILEQERNIDGILAVHVFVVQNTKYEYMVFE
jgi:hypothetical protein